ncbi:hypothetical protein K432DRAFT_57595, partial [Lepidopterella palustris CBS 459.81]
GHITKKGFIIHFSVLLQGSRNTSFPRRTNLQRNRSYTTRRASVGTVVAKKSRLNNEAKKKYGKTYNSWDSPLVTHANTSQPLRVFNIGERTGPVVLLEVWSYVKEQGK